jgi:predicted permease
MHKIVKIILVVLGVIGAILWFQLPSADVPVTEAINNGSMNFMFIITYVLLGIAIAASLLFGLKNLLTSKGALKKTLFGVGGLLVVVVISYALATGTDVNLEEMAKKGVPTTESTVKSIGMGLNVFFILTIIAVGAMLWSGVKKMISK